MITSLDRRLGPLDAAAIVISNVIGGGIFFVPMIVAQLVPSGPAIMLVWLLGSLAQTTGPQLAVAAPLLAFGVCGLLLLARDLNVLVLGDEQAQYLGLNVAQRRLLTDTCHRQGLPS